MVDRTTFASRSDPLFENTPIICFVRFLFARHMPYTCVGPFSVPVVRQENTREEELQQAPESGHTFLLPGGAGGLRNHGVAEALVAGGEAMPGGGSAPEKVQDPGFAHVMQKGGAAQPVVEVAFKAGLVVVDVSVDLLDFFKLVSAHPAPEAEAQFA